MRNIGRQVPKLALMVLGACTKDTVVLPSAEVLSVSESETAVPLAQLPGTPFFLVDIGVGSAGATRMLVDTGASDTVLFKWFAVEHGLPTSPAGSEGQDSGGQGFQLELAQVSSLSLGSTVKTTKVLPVVPTIRSFEEAGVGGIFSPQAFFEREEFTIDFPNKKLVGAGLSKDLVARRRQIERAALSPCNKRGTKFSVEAAVNGVPGRFYLDTGGQRSVMTRKFADRLGSKKGTPSYRQGVGGSIRGVESLDDVPVVIGSTQLTSEMDIEPKRVACSGVDGKLGGDILGRYALFFDAPRTEVQLYE